MNIKLCEAIQANDLERAQKFFLQELDLLKFIVAKGLPRSIQSGLNLLGGKAVS